MKTAHVGIALSNAEPIMVTSFTSLDMFISAVTEAICEGRGTLASALAAYANFIAYGQLSACTWPYGTSKTPGFFWTVFGQPAWALACR
jgi:magnesium-transporting ATPase (P-type)